MNPAGWGLSVPSGFPLPQATKASPGQPRETQLYTPKGWGGGGLPTAARTLTLYVLVVGLWMGEWLDI